MSWPSPRGTPREPGSTRACTASNGRLDYEALITDPEVEVVFNALPNGLHAPWNSRALRAGKQVLTEKPSASNGPEARQVQQVVAETGRHYIEAFHYRYHPVIARLLETVGSGEIGEVVRVESRVVIPAPPVDDLRWSYELAGGALMDIGCYSLHVQRTLGALLGGEPTLVSARGEEGPANVDARVEAALAFPSGATGLATCDMDADAWSCTALVAGTLGEVLVPRFIDCHEDPRVVVTVAGATREEVLPERSTYDFQLDALTALIRAGTPVPTDAEDAARTMELIDRVYEACGIGVRPTHP